MKETLKSLHSVLGVEGAFLCDYEGNVAASTCPESYNKDAMSKIGYAFSLGVRVARQQNITPKAIYGTFEEGRVVVRPFEKGLLVVLGDIATKQLLLKAALDQAEKKLSGMEIVAEKTTDLSQLQVSVERVRLDQALLDQKLLERWQKQEKTTTIIRQVELQTEQGKVAVFSVKSKKGLGDSVGLNAGALKELGIAEGEMVTVRPVIRLTSEVEDFFG
ncbi:hypothetical protein JXM67_14360 [candidate division WOR-3 bacterium]|nr:hypothetical protein [candidate division WOR-3 bacterium]